MFFETLHDLQCTACLAQRPTERQKISLGPKKPPPQMRWKGEEKKNFPAKDIHNTRRPSSKYRGNLLRMNSLRNFSLALPKAFPLPSILKKDRTATSQFRMLYHLAIGKCISLFNLYSSPFGCGWVGLNKFSIAKTSETSPLSFIIKYEMQMRMGSRSI